MSMIQPIVEGYGEVEAVPRMIHTIAINMGISHIKVGEPIRRKRSEFCNEERFLRAVKLACLKPECSAIIALCDADDDCPKDLGPRIRKWLEGSAMNKACSVVLPKREFEAWFLASMGTLKGYCGIHNTKSVRDPETIRDAKGELERRMPENRSYHEKIDQKALVKATDWSLVYSRTRSGRKLIEDMRRLFSSMGYQPNTWPKT